MHRPAEAMFGASFWSIGDCFATDGLRCEETLSLASGSRFSVIGRGDDFSRLHARFTRLEADGGDVDASEQEKTESRVRIREFSLFHLFSSVEKPSG